MKQILFLLILITSTVAAQVASEFGKVSGIVFDKKSKSPLAGVNVFFVGTTIGSSTSIDGKFLISRIPHGIYKLKFSLIGYKEIIESVEIEPNKEIVIEKILEEEPILLQDVVVTPVPEKFDASGISAKIDRRMVTEAPGSAQDIFWVIQTLPGISSGSDDSKIYVRGGAANENLVLFDGNIISNPFHFNVLGGGLFSVFNSRLVQNVEFYAGGFPARYGDRLASVLLIKNKEGNKERLSGEVNLSLSDLNAIVEIPLKIQNASAVFSFRRSYFDLVLNLIPDLKGDYDVVPYFLDTYGKLDFSINEKNKVVFSYLTSNEKMSGNYNKPHFQGDLNVKSKNNLFGLSLYSTLSEKVLSELNLFYSKDDRNASYPENSFEIIKTTEKGFKEDIALFLDNHEIHTGFWLINKQGDTDINLTKDANIYSLEELIVKSQGDFNLYSLYIEDKVKFSDAITANIGIRYDYVDKSKEGNIAPRINVAYSWNEHMSLSFDYGWFYQSPYPYEFSLNPNLKSKKAESIGLGIRHQLSDKFILSLQAYNKKLSGLTTFNNLSGQFSNDGFGFARGLEFYLQLKPSNGFFGWLSYSYSVAKRKEYTHKEEHYFNLDRTHLISVVGNYNFSETWQVGLKYRFGTGTPYTPPVGSIFDPQQNRYSPVVGEQNSARFQAYQRLDMRITKKIPIWNTSINVYFELLNVFNNVNVVHYLYSEDYTTKEPMTVFPILPVIGFSVKI
ncbi:MAG: TonB-dependent receptor [Melioribacteraceae bacterium]